MGLTHVIYIYVLREVGICIDLLKVGIPKLSTDARILAASFLNRPRFQAEAIGEAAMLEMHQQHIGDLSSSLIWQKMQRFNPKKVPPN